MSDKRFICACIGAAGLASFATAIYMPGPHVGLDVIFALLSAYIGTLFTICALAPWERKP